MLKRAVLRSGANAMLSRGTGMVQKRPVLAMPGS